MRKATPFLAAAAWLILVAVVAVGLSGCSGTGCNDAFGSCIGIGEPQDPDVLACRTIEVDQCFAVQCGYALGTADAEVVANELFCPEDYLSCDYTEPNCTNTEGKLCFTPEYLRIQFSKYRAIGFQEGRDSVTCDDPCTSCDVPVVCPEPVCDEDDDSDSDSDSGWDCDDSDSDSGWDCDDFADRVPGHRPIECRGKGHAK